MSTTPSGPKKFDVRILERNMKHGVLTRKQVDEHLASLPDVSHKAISLAPTRDSAPRQAAERAGAAPTGARPRPAPPAGAERTSAAEEPAEPARDAGVTRESLADESAGSIH